MNKKLIAMAAAAAFALPLSAQADDVSVSGFADIIYTNSSKAFGADAEIDVVKTSGAVTVRVDTDLALGGNGPTAHNMNRAAIIEQALFAWAATDAVTVIGGVFNNPIGQEAEDAPDFFFTTHSVIYNILNQQTALYGNNVAGVAVAGAVGPVTLTAAILNDIGGSAKENSFAIVANTSPIEGLDLEFGYVTQVDNFDVTTLGTATPLTQTGNVWDFNASYNIGQITVVADVLGAATAVDLAYNIWAMYDVNEQLSLRVRYENVDYGTLGSNNKITGYIGYAIQDNLYVALETNSSTSDTTNAFDGINGDNAETTLEFIASF